MASVGKGVCGLVGAGLDVGRMSASVSIVAEISASFCLTFSKILEFSAYIFLTVSSCEEDECSEINWDRLGGFLRLMVSHNALKRRRRRSVYVAFFLLNSRFSD